MTSHDVHPAPPTIEARTVAAITPAPSPPPVVVVQEVTPTVIELTVPATQADSIVATSSTIVTPLLIADVVTIGAPMVLALSSLAPMAFPSTVLVTMASPYSFSRLRVSMGHLYTSSNANQLWGATYKLK